MTNFISHFETSNIELLLYKNKKSNIYKIIYKLSLYNEIQM